MRGYLMMMKKCEYIKDNKSCREYKKATWLDRCRYLREDIYNHCDYTKEKT